MIQKAVYGYLFKAVLIISILFALISLLIIFPVYKLSEYSPKLYSIIVSVICILILIGNMMLKIRKINSRYHSPVHTLFSVALAYSPLFYVLFMLFLEALMFRVSFIINFYLFIALEILFHIILVLITVNLINFRQKLTKSLNTCRNTELKVREVHS